VVSFTTQPLYAWENRPTEWEVGGSLSQSECFGEQNLLRPLGIQPQMLSFTAHAPSSFIWTCQ